MAYTVVPWTLPNLKGQAQKGILRENLPAKALLQQSTCWQYGEMLQWNSVNSGKF